MSLLIFTVPSYAINHLWGSSTFHDQANRVFIPSRRVRCISRNDKCFSFSDDDVSEGVILDDFEKHVAFDLVEPFLLLD